MLCFYQIKYRPAAAADLRQAERGEMPHESVTVMLPWEDEPDTPRLDCNLPEPDCVCFPASPYLLAGLCTSCASARGVFLCSAIFCVSSGAMGRAGKQYSTFSPKSKIGSTQEAAQVSRPPGAAFWCTVSALEDR